MSLAEKVTQYHQANSSGNVVGTYTYDAYGKQISTTVGINNNFRYGGKYGYYYDEQVYGMYLAGARWYSPDLYRWMSRDPIEYAGGDNMFAYVAGNPVKYVDPSGLLVVCIRVYFTDMFMCVDIDQDSNPGSGIYRIPQSSCNFTEYFTKEEFDIYNSIGELYRDRFSNRYS